MTISIAHPSDDAYETLKIVQRQIEKSGEGARGDNVNDGGPAAAASSSSSCADYATREGDVEYAVDRPPSGGETTTAPLGIVLVNDDDLEAVRVSEVDPGGLFGRQTDHAPGVVLRAANGRSCGTIADFATALRTAAGAGTVSIVVAPPPEVPVNSYAAMHHHARAAAADDAKKKKKEKAKSREEEAAKEKVMTPPQLHNPNAHPSFVDLLDEYVDAPDRNGQFVNVGKWGGGSKPHQWNYRIPPPRDDRLRERHVRDGGGLVPREGRRANDPAPNYLISFLLRRRLSFVLRVHMYIVLHIIVSNVNVCIYVLHTSFLLSISSDIDNIRLSQLKYRYVRVCSGVRM